MLLLRHLNKGTSRNPIYRGGGSIGIIGAARPGCWPPMTPTTTTGAYWQWSKATWPNGLESLAYKLVEAGDYGVARVQWDGQTHYTATSLLDPDETTATTRGRDPGYRTSCPVSPTSAPSRPTPSAWPPRLASQNAR